MTAGAADLRMLSVKFISSLIMIEIFYFPYAGCMAPGTIRGSLVLKLLLMYICMAICAVLGKSGKLLSNLTGIVLPEMT